jgi:hypothetical protein
MSSNECSLLYFTIALFCSIDFILNILYNVSTFINGYLEEMYIEFYIISLDISLDLCNLYR